MRRVTPQPIFGKDLSASVLELCREYSVALNQLSEHRFSEFVSVTGTYTAGQNDHVIECAPSGTMTVTLPAASTMRNKRIVVKRTNNTTHVITIQSSSGNIDGAASVTLTTAHQSRELFSDGANWWLLDTSAAAASDYLTTTDGTVEGVTLTNSKTNVSWAVPATANFFVLRSDQKITGKAYCEFACTTAPATMSHGFGVQRKACSTFYNDHGGSMFTGNGGCGLPSSGYQNEASTTTSASYSFATGDIIGVAFDATTRELWFSKNGTWISGDPAAGTSPTMTISTSQDYYFALSAYSCSISSGTYVYQVYPSAATQNYAAPSGFSPHQ